MYNYPNRSADPLTLTLSNPKKVAFENAGKIHDELKQIICTCRCF